MNQLYWETLGTDSNVTTDADAGEMLWCCGAVIVHHCGTTCSSYLMMLVHPKCIVNTKFVLGIAESSLGRGRKRGGEGVQRTASCTSFATHLSTLYLQRSSHPWGLRTIFVGWDARSLSFAIQCNDCSLTHHWRSRWSMSFSNR